MGSACATIASEPSKSRSLMTSINSRAVPRTGTGTDRRGTRPSSGRTQSTPIYHFCWSARSRERRPARHLVAPLRRKGAKDRCFRAGAAESNTSTAAIRLRGLPPAPFGERLFFYVSFLQGSTSMESGRQQAQADRVDGARDEAARSVFRLVPRFVRVPEPLRHRICPACTARFEAQAARVKRS